MSETKIVAIIRRCIGKITIVVACMEIIEGRDFFLF